MSNNQNKKCINCEEIKQSSYFSIARENKDGKRNICKECDKINIKYYSKTKKGVVTMIYGGQKKSSVKRNHNQPTYKKKELQEWLMNDWLFGLLFDNWKNCGHIKGMKPSVDRIDDSKGYSFDNIQLMTWSENEDKGYKDMRSGKLQHGVNPQKIVNMYDLEMNFISEYHSINEAERQTGIIQAGISQCCLGKSKTSGGFIWKFKKEQL